MFSRYTLLRAGCVVALLCFIPESPSLAQTQVATPQASAASSYQLVEAVPYRIVDGQTLVCDLYLPKGAGPFPAVLLIHGGGWGAGNRTQLRRQAAYLADRGYFGMAIDYRLAPANPFPAAFDDAQAALVWLKAHAVQYHVDPSRTAAIGSSAGGHLSAMLGVESGRNSSTGQAPGIQAVVAFNGIFDLNAMPPSQMVANFIGNACSDAPQRCKDASPLTFVRPGLPPFLILHGTADQTAPYAQATAFVAALQAAHDPVKLFTAPGAPHTFWSQPKWTEPSFEAMYAFLADTIGHSSTPRSLPENLAH